MKLPNDTDAPQTLTEIAASFSCSLELIRRISPQLSKALIEKYQNYQKAELRRRLESFVYNNEYPPLHLKEVIKKVGSSSAYLRRHFPELCDVIVLRYKAYRK